MEAKEAGGNLTRASTNHLLFSLAGLWERRHDPEREEIEICAILATEANELMRPLHVRMLVILDLSADVLGLDSHASADVLRSLCVPFASDRMEAYPVNPYGSNAKKEGLRSGPWKGRPREIPLLWANRSARY